MVEESPVRSFIAVLGGLGLFALVTEALEFTLVTAAAGGPIGDRVDDRAGHGARRLHPLTSHPIGES